jgi:hypothetical protein
MAFGMSTVEGRVAAALCGGHLATTFFEVCFAALATAFSACFAV